MEVSVLEGKIDNVPVDPLEGFSPATATWFREVFARPTAAQVGAWQAISLARMRWSSHRLARARRLPPSYGHSTI